MENRKLHIASGDCRECYRCVRVCPVKAIEIHGSKAEIRSSECISCGACLTVCPQGLIEQPEQYADIEQAMDIKGACFVVSLHWSWFDYFKGVSASTLCRALEELGFAKVSEALWGVKAYNEQLQLMVASKGERLKIATPCPVVRQMLGRHYPMYKGSLLDVANPMALHGRMLRKIYKESQIKVVYIAPCIGYSNELEHGDYAITFKELKSWITNRSIDLKEHEGDASGYGFQPSECPSIVHPAVKSPFVESYSLVQAQELLNQLAQNGKQYAGMAIEISGCFHCLAGYMGCASWQSVEQYIAYRKHFKAKQYLTELGRPNIETKYCSTFDDFVAPKVSTEYQITEALESLSMYQAYDYHNCNACGYGTCRAFAAALSQDKVGREMCLAYARKQMYRKFTTLLDKMPSGVMLVDQDLKIIEASRKMATIMGRDALLVFDAEPGMKGADTTKLVPFSHLFQQVLETGEDIKECEVEIEEGRLLSISIFTIERDRSLCVVASNLVLGGAIDSQVLIRTQEVIQENLNTAKLIAELLGKSTARTQGVLSSITSHNKSGR